MLQNVAFKGYNKISGRRTGETNNVGKVWVWIPRCKDSGFDFMTETSLHTVSSSCLVTRENLRLHPGPDRGQGQGGQLTGRQPKGGTKTSLK
jgi:hypothetical protein